MWTRLALMTVCLATCIRTDTVVDPSLGVVASEEDFQDYPITDDNLTTEVYNLPKIDIDTSPASELLTDLNLEADIDISTSASIPEVTKGRKDEGNPRNENNCGDPPAALHAKIVRGRKHLYVEGDVVHYSCDFGYVARASEWTSKCFFSDDTNVLEWTPPQIMCSPRSCGDPGFVENGHRIGSLFTFPNRVVFECDEGYELRGNGIRYCKTSGTWSGSLPTCENIFCDPPLNPENGKVSYTSLEFGSELVYECQKGFILRNLQPRICSGNGTWSGDVPICQEAQCEPPVAPDHGTVQVVGGKSNVGSRAIYTCDGDRFLVGSTTSTCLDIGHWTFPTPKCLEPCAVPKVPHGKIGKYEKYYRRLRYKELSEGTKIEDGSELVLSCESKYEPFGTTNIEEKIYCNHGKWDRYPRCEPAICRSPAPQTPNASIRETSFSRSHGAGVVYDCHTFYMKSKYGNVSCHYGTWKGNIPTCKDTRCDVNSLASFSIKKTTKRYYKSQDVLMPHCETGYTALTPNSRIMCLNGDWKGLNPLPCTPANCSEEPPEIENGQITNFAIHHTSEVIYTCNEFFILKDLDSKVRCKFGKWIGAKPTCQDTRCYVENLKNIESISVDTERITYNGDTLQVQCAEGFSSEGIDTKCVNGEWENHQPLCKESDCNLYNIDHGKFTEKVPMRKCNMWGLNCKNWQAFEEVSSRRIFPAGASLYVSCDDGYVYKGIRSRQNVYTKCFRGQWNPSAVCLRPGTSYYEKAFTPNSHISAAKSTVKTLTTKAIFRTTPRPEGEAEKRRQEIASQPPVTDDTHNVNCSCRYLNSDNILRAFAGTEKLLSGTLVKDGCKVTFHCSPVGIYRLNGPREITCKDCRTWHSAEYPQCEALMADDVILNFDGHYIELPGGAIGVNPGTSMRVVCFILSPSYNYPKWISFPKSSTITYYWYNYGGQVYPSQILELSDISPEQSGIYECAAEGHRPASVTIKVKTSNNDPAPKISCSKFSEDEYFTVYYDKGQSFNSSAVFSCKDPKQNIVGPNILTCLSNGQWSGVPPQCIRICPELEETEGMFITYNDDRRTRSSAVFNCDLPRVLSGVSSTICKHNGEWADSPPICEMPSCKIADLYNVLPEYAVPNVDNLEGDTVPYDFSLSLECDDNRRLVGTSEKAKCKHEGQWEIAKVQCVIGCAPVSKLPDSEIVIDPEEEFYEIGQFVTFSCVPGLKLSMELERIMCLPGGWSQNVVPTCVTDDYVNDEGTQTEGLSSTGGI